MHLPDLFVFDIFAIHFPGWAGGPCGIALLLVHILHLLLHALHLLFRRPGHLYYG